jgi:thiosulfate dehydrogenase
VRGMAWLLLAAACGPVPAAERGAALFSDPGFSGSRFNAFSCATCHGTRPEDDAPPRIGRTLHDVAGRAAWWGGYAPRLIDAVDACAVFFMRAAPLDPDDERARALYEYLVSISPGGSLPARPLTMVENVTTVARGDPGRGRIVWDRACRICHGAPHTGRDRISTLVAIVPEASQVFAAEIGAPADLVVIEKVRHGQFFGVGGNMPFFSREALSDDDLGALIAYLRL